MKTKDYAAMTVMALREECKNLGLTGYGKMTKDQLVDTLSSKVIKKGFSEKVENIPSEDKKVWTDRHMIPLEKGTRVNARINARWFQGTVVNFKEIEGEEHVSVLLDGKEVSKLFHSTDIEILVGTKAGKLENVPSVEEETKNTSKKSEGVKKDPTPKKSSVQPFTEEQIARINADITLFREKKISKKELVVGWMEFGITKQQIDKFVDPTVVGWSYAYSIYREHGK